MDSVKKKALNARYKKLFGKNFAKSQPRPRGVDSNYHGPWNNWTDAGNTSIPTNVTDIVSSSNNNRTRPLFTKRFRGGTSVTGNGKYTGVTLVFRKIFYTISAYRKKILITIIVVLLLFVSYKIFVRNKNTKGRINERNI